MSFRFKLSNATRSFVTLCFQHTLTRAADFRRFLWSLHCSTILSFPRLLLFSPLRKKFFSATMTSADFLQFSCTSLHRLDGCQSICPSPHCKTSPVKSSNLPLIYLPHLHRRVQAVLDFALFGKLVPSAYALYVISVRQTESLL